MKYLGDLAEDQVIDFKFSTHQSGGTPITLAGTPAVAVYVENSTTEITSGVTLTVDFDGRTGCHHVRIDTSASASYAVAKDYQVVITTGTVDGVSVVGTVLAIFSIENRFIEADLTKIGGDAQSATDLKDFADAGYDPATNKVQGVVLVDTVTTATDLTNERGKYANGSVWIGPTANTNTVSYVDGITTNPVSTIAAAKTIADALGLRRFHTIRTGTTQLGAAMAGYDFGGEGWSLTTIGGSRDVGGSTFERATLSGGTFAGTSGTIHWFHCEFPVAVSVGVSNFNACTFGDTLTLSEAGSYDFIDCAGIVAGAGTPVFAVPAGTVSLSFRRWAGGIRITGITAGTTISINAVSGSSVTLEGADGDVTVHGMIGTITDSRTGTPTLTQNAMLNRTVLATPTNITAGTITTATNVTTVNGLAANTITAASIASDAITSAKLAADCITAAKIAADAIGSDELAAGAIAKIFTSQMTESYATSGTAPTLAQCLFLIQQSLHEFAISGATRTVKKIDGSTTAATFTFDDATSPTSTTRTT